MIKFTSQELQQNTSHIQSLARHTPVMIAHGDQQQVLMPYDDYVKMGGERKPFVSLAEMIGYTPAAEIDFDEEADLSFTEQV